MSKLPPVTEGLGARLRQANSRELHQLIVVHGRELTLGDVRHVLRNPFVTGQAIEEILANRRLTAIYEVRSAVARHRRTPQAAALRFLSGLFWRDLLEISVDVRIAPAVRRVAEKYLIRRLTRLTTGEKVALARRATREVAGHLLTDSSALVVEALLGNPRLTEETLLPMAANERTPPRILDLVARNPRWGRRYGIRVALSRNPQTPFRAVFKILPALRRSDLVAVAEKEGHSWVVRHRAGEVLAERSVQS